MAIWNGYPATYQPMYPQYQQPMAGTQMPQPAQQMFTPPTIRAEIVQVDGEEAAKAYPVGAGATQMLMAKDDSAIYIKTSLPNGQSNLVIYEKRPPAPPSPVFDPSLYVRRDEVETLISAALAAQNGAVKRSRTEVE